MHKLLHTKVAQIKKYNKRVVSLNLSYFISFVVHDRFQSFPSLGALIDAIIILYTG